jgi:Flp pilus assembly pilin Flp
VTGNARKYTTGQAMVEYAVVLVALTLAVLAVGDGDFSTPEDSNIDELRQAVDFRYRGYTYAVSLSEYPESEDLLEIADYYDSLGKHPELADQMRGGVSTIEGYVEDYVSTTAYFRDFDPDLPDDFESIDIGAIISDLSGF